jgi:hypothetical protein
MPKIRKSMPWKRRQEIPNASVLDAAVQFHEGCLVLWEKLQADGGVLLPFLNTASMAIELYLKTLTTDSKWVPQPDGVSSIYADPTRGHEPTKLLKIIPPDVRAKLDVAFAAWQGSNGQTIEQRCAVYDTLFMTSRYVFEESRKLGGFTLEPLLAFIDFLKTFVESLPAEERLYA